MVISQTNPKVPYSSLSTGEVRDRLRVICSQSTTVEQIKARIKEELGSPGEPLVDISNPRDEGHREMFGLVRALGGFITGDNRAVNILMWGPDGKIL